MSFGEREAAARRVSRVVVMHSCARTGLTSYSLMKRRRALSSSCSSAIRLLSTLPGRTPVSAPHAGRGQPERSAARYIASFMSRWHTRSVCRASVIAAFAHWARPLYMPPFMRRVQQAVVRCAVWLRLISSRSPSGLPSGYSGRSAGNIVSSICSTAYLYSCP